MELLRQLADVTDVALVRVGAAVLFGLAFTRLTRRVIPRVLRFTLNTSVDRLDRMEVFGPRVEEQVRRRVATLEGFVTRVISTAVSVAVIVYVLTVAGVRLEPIVASAGVVGIALAFGAQTLVRDALSGIFLIVENPYNLGDYVRLNTVEGEVRAISLRRTTLAADDGTEHTVPNGSITQTSNYTRASARHALTLRIAAEVPLERVIEAVDAVALDLSRAPEVGEELVEGPSVRGITAWRSESYDVEVRALMLRSLRRRWPYLVNRQLMLAFRERDIRVL